MIKDSDAIWHARLGHLGQHNLSVLKTMSTAIHDVPPGTICEACALTKSKEQPHSGKIARGTRKLEVISIDICGPFRDLGSKGERYWLTIVCHFTSQTWAFPTSDKESGTVVRALRDFFEH